MQQRSIGDLAVDDSGPTEEKDRSNEGAKADEGSSKQSSAVGHPRDEEHAHELGLPAEMAMVAHKHRGFAWALAAGVLVLLIAAVAGISLTFWEIHEKHVADQARQQAATELEKSKAAEKKSQDDNRRLEAAQKSLEANLDDEKSQKHSWQTSEENQHAVLQFLESTLLSAGRPADQSLVEAYWQGTVNKERDVSLRKAIDETASKVSGAFAERPLAEAIARQVIGQAYLNLGKPALAVPQYEKALELREAFQGGKDPETGECRNKLAIAYRLADRTTEASRLFEQNPDTLAYADVLVVRGKVLLSNHQPAKAELGFRQSLNYRRQHEPDEWTTFETESLLGESLLEQQKYDQAEVQLRSAYRGLKALQDHAPAGACDCLVKTLERLAQLYEKRGQTEEAQRCLKELKTTPVDR